MRGSSSRRERGSAIILVLAVVAAAGVLAAISARQLLTHRRLVDRAHHEAVLRNLAEGGVAAARSRLEQGRPLGRPELADEPLGPLTGVVRLTVEREDGARRVQAVSRLRGPDAPPLSYRVVARLRLEGGQVRVLAWQESLLTGAGGE